MLACWQQNAQAWTHCVRSQAIESRRLVTDQAVLQAAELQSPRTVLDLGCGEGWLTRKLGRPGRQVWGVDASPALIEQARQHAGDFQVWPYERLEHWPHRVDCVVANFSLLGEQSVTQALSAIPKFLDGTLIVQTLHPWTACPDLPYKNGWRLEHWEGFGDGFTPTPWFFRTFESWLDELFKADFRLLRVQEPIHPGTGKPASLLLIAATRSQAFQEI